MMLIRAAGEQGFGLSAVKEGLEHRQKPLPEEFADSVLLRNAELSSAQRSPTCWRMGK